VDIGGKATNGTPSASESLVPIDPSKAIKASLESGATPVIELSQGNDALLPGSSLLDSASAGKDVGIRASGETICLSPSLVAEWGVVSSSKVLVSLGKTDEKASISLSSALASLDMRNEALIKDIISLKIKVDGKEIKRSAFPIKVVVDVSKLDGTQKANLTGILLDGKLSSHKVLGGKLSGDLSEFVFYTYDTGNLSVIASTQVQKLTLSIGQKTYGKNGMIIENDVSPYISEDNRTMLPVRAIAESLGADVDWSGEISTATISKDGKSASVTLGVPLPNGLGTPAIVQDRLFVPVRCIAEMLGANVVWNEEDKSVDIYS
jgi:hypothetical protein